MTKLTSPFLYFALLLCILIPLQKCAGKFIKTDFISPTTIKNEGYRWTAEDVEMYFDVSNDFYDTIHHNMRGNVKLDNKDYLFVFTLSYSGIATFYTSDSFYTEVDKNTGEELLFLNDDGLFLIGKLVMDKSEEKFVLKVNEEYQNAFGKNISRITFNRSKTPE